MRKFIVNVNGKQYEVEVEELAGGAAAPVAVPVAAAPVAPVAAPVAAAPAPAAKPAAAPAGEGKAICAPMPGTILEIKAAVGASVKKGDVLAILEAMKMENEIQSDVDGVVTAVVATKGASVNTGDTILTVK
jgi:biotin carboxyl carrier protein